MTVSSVVKRALDTSRGIEFLPDDKFNKLFPIESKAKVFQNFSWFAQTNRDEQINAFAKYQIPVLAADLDAKLEQTILEDEPAVIQELKQKYNPLQVTKLEDLKK